MRRKRKRMTGKLPSRRRSPSSFLTEAHGSSSVTGSQNPCRAINFSRYPSTRRLRQSCLLVIGPAGARGPACFSWRCDVPASDAGPWGRSGSLDQPAGLASKNSVTLGLGLRAELEPGHSGTAERGLERLARAGTGLVAC
jgi:hypothetical protein